MNNNDIIDFCKQVSKVNKARKRVEKLESQYNDDGYPLEYEPAKTDLNIACSTFRDLLGDLINSEKNSI